MNFTFEQMVNFADSENTYHMNAVKHIEDSTKGIPNISAYLHDGGNDIKGKGKIELGGDISNTATPNATIYPAYKKLKAALINNGWKYSEGYHNNVFRHPMHPKTKATIEDADNNPPRELTITTT